MFDHPDDFETSRKIVENSGEFQEVFDTVDDLIDFYDNVINFFPVNSATIIAKEGSFNLSTHLISSVKFTLNSIKKCLEYRAMTDAFTLLRKKRDDLFLYLYILEVANNNPAGMEDLPDKQNKHIKDVFDWKNNELKDLYISDISKYLRNNPKIDKVLENHDLMDFYWEIYELLNDCVHTNGIKYARYNYTNELNKIDLEVASSNFHFSIKYISLLFVTFLIPEFGK